MPDPAEARPGRQRRVFRRIKLLKQLQSEYRMYSGPTVRVPIYGIRHRPLATRTVLSRSVSECRVAESRVRDRVGAWWELGRRVRGAWTRENVSEPAT